MTDQVTGREMGPLFFVVVFWGEEHRNYFLHLCAPALLAPGNIPCLAANEGHRFLICTTASDWRAMQDDPDYIALAKAISVEWIEMSAPGFDENKYLVMSAGHKLAANMAFAAGARGVYLTPDLLLADGAVRTIERLSNAGSKVILSVAMRFTYEDAVPKIESTRKFAGEPLVLSPRTLAGIALHSMHLETRRYDWSSGCFSETPYSCFWWVTKGGAIVVHSVSWAPLMVDYSTLDSHSTETLETWTMDGDYVYSNFGTDNAVHVIQDTDELMLISFTRQADLLGYLSQDDARSNWYNRIPIISEAWKTSRLRKAIALGATDPLKRRLLSMPVRFHNGKVSERRWAAAERRAKRVLAKAFAEPSRFEIRCVEWVERSQGSESWPLSLFHRAKTGFRPDREIKLLNQSGLDTHRTVVVAPPVSSGKWYWEIASPNLGAVNGMIGDTCTVGVVDGKHSLRREIGFGGLGWGWRANGLRVTRSQTESYGIGASNESGSVVMIALDSTRGRLWFGLDGVWFDDGDPAADRHPSFTGLNGRLFPAMSSLHGGSGTAELHSRVKTTTFHHQPPDGFQALLPR